ncbi:jg13548 [Pararge aegeria aegeria]|uniref:Jg13548 protein n=1 Tax=Pararge aegeria aegeria TaxID=348720 RepID=A0A8S4S577_9NEOP|nr:jg13548 [Pararge aegeria aegeria]
MLTQYSFILFEVIYVVVVWGDLDEVSEASYLLFTQASVCYKVTIFIANKKQLKYLLDFMKLDIFDPQTPDHDKVIFTNARRIKRLCAMFLTAALVTVSLWAIMPLFDKAESRYFPFKIWMPVDAQDSPHYELGYIYQIMSIYCSALLFFAVDSTILSMVMFGCAQLEIIIDKIQKVKSTPLSAKLRQEEYKEAIGKNNELLKECLRQHQAVISSLSCEAEVQWAGHIARGTDGSWGPKELEWRPRTGKRSVGQPPTRLTDDMKRSVTADFGALYKRLMSSSECQSVDIFGLLPIPNSIRSEEIT